MRDAFKSSITIKVIDTKKLFPELLARLRNSVDDKKGKEWDRIKDALYRAKELTVQSSELGYVETPRGIFLLDYEACSMGCREEPITDDDSILAPVFFSYEKSFDVFLRWRSTSPKRKFCRGRSREKSIFLTSSRRSTSLGSRATSATGIATSRAS